MQMMDVTAVVFSSSLAIAGIGCTFILLFRLISLFHGFFHLPRTSHYYLLIIKCFVAQKRVENVSSWQQSCVPFKLVLFVIASDHHCSEIMILTMKTVFYP